MNMRRIGFALALLLSATCADGARAQNTLSATFGAANEAYFAGDFSRASEGYEQLIELGVRDSDVYFNLGVARARNGRLGASIAAFENALVIEPGDERARTALERTRNALAERRAEREGEAVTPAGPRFSEAIWSGVSSSTLAVALLLLEVLSLLALTGALFLRAEGTRLGFGIAAPILVIATVFVGVGLHARAHTRRDAIVVVDRLPLLEGPREGSRERGRAREGDRVVIEGEDGDWAWLRAETRSGWAKRSAMEPLL